MMVPTVSPDARKGSCHAFRGAFYHLKEVHSIGPQKPCNAV